METMLFYCTRCGTKVEPYLPSTSSYYRSGEPQNPGGEDRSYWCEHCGERFVATNLCDTGWMCGSCNVLMPMRNSFCGVCGRGMAQARKSQYELRYARLYRQSDDVREISAQLQDLRSVLYSAIQDIAVLRRMLEKRGIWSETEYKAMRIQQMLMDHSSAGASPWQTYSHYPYTLDEDQFLRERLRASETEVAAFKENVEGLASQT